MLADIAISYSLTHLGVLIRGEMSGKVVAMPTSEVYSDPDLAWQLLRLPKHHLDSGIQAQLYVGPEDTLLVFRPHVTSGFLHSLSESLRANASIWKRLTGLQILPKQVTVACDSFDEDCQSNNENIRLIKGTLPEASVSTATESGQSLLGFVYSSDFHRQLGGTIPLSPDLDLIAKQTDLFMDKNLAMDFLAQAGFPVAKTHPFARETFSPSQLDSLDDANYVFKPAGGAAGLGLFPKGTKGAVLATIKGHLQKLELDGTLPQKFQLQEHLSGPVWGAMGLILPEKKWNVLQVHSQEIDAQGRFSGGRWCQPYEAQRMEFAEKLFAKLASLDKLGYLGLIELDLIGEKIIEVNPRITASSPICHLLSLENKLQSHIGNSFRIRQLDINTQVQFPRQADKLKLAEQLIQETHNQSGTLILPQGINPVGMSRVVIVNDREDSRYQQQFLAALRRL